MRRIKQFALHKENGFRRVVAMSALLTMLFVVFALPAAAQNRYRITDGDRVLIYTTDATDPVEVLDEAGLELGKDDTYTTRESGAYSEIHVQRIQMVTINNGGQILKTGTYGETVGELLERLNLTYSSEDEISAQPEDTTFDGMEIVISRKHYVTETYSQTIPYATSYCTDPSLPMGQQQVLAVGSEGEMLCTAQVAYVDGVEESRTVVSEKVVTAAVDALIAVGTGEAEEHTPGELYIGDGYIVSPEGDILTYSRVMDCLATAYTCEGWGRPGITATGTVAQVGTVAVDPTVIPYGTRFFIVSEDGEYIYGVGTAEDTGHEDFICGTRIDLYMDTEAECVQFGARDCQVYILG